MFAYLCAFSLSNVALGRVGIDADTARIGKRLACRAANQVVLDVRRRVRRMMMMRLILMIVRLMVVGVGSFPLLHVVGRRP